MALRSARCARTHVLLVMEVRQIAQSAQYHQPIAHQHPPAHALLDITITVQRNVLCVLINAQHVLALLQTAPLAQRQHQTALQHRHAHALLDIMIVVLRSAHNAHINALPVLAVPRIVAHAQHPHPTAHQRLPVRVQPATTMMELTHSARNARTDAQSAVETLQIVQLA